MASLLLPPIPQEIPKPKPWLHFVAGGLGGMCGTFVTNPFDVVKTRLQSDLFRQKQATFGLMGNGGGVVMSAPRPTNFLYNFVETGHIIRYIYREESFRALFKGLGPSLVGVIPARSINFFVIGNGKRIIAEKFNHGKENSLVVLAAAATSGIVTSTVTNPIWVVKTRLQIATSTIGANGEPSKLLGGSWACIKKIMREDGARGFYKGLGASYVGVTETVIQWVLYEWLKKLSGTEDRTQGFLTQWTGILASIGSAKVVAGVIAYPHEVIRTRLRQPSVNGVTKYTGVWQTLRLVIAEEGARSLYSGLSAHLMRVVPNAAVTYSIYEGLIKWGA